MVTIFVGSKRKEFMIHKDLICGTAEFFNKAFNGHFMEKDGVMYLPDDNPEAFTLFVDWLYRHKIPSGNSESYIHTLYDLYIMANKMCLEDLMDATMDTIQDTAKEHDLLDVLFTKDLFLKVVSALTCLNAGLVNFLICLTSYATISRIKSPVAENEDGESASERTSPAFDDDDLDMIWDFGKDNKALYKNIQNQILSDMQCQAALDPRERDEDDATDRCFFHCHNDKNNCSLQTREIPGFIMDINKDMMRTKAKNDGTAKRYHIVQIFSDTNVWLLKSKRLSWVLTYKSRANEIVVTNKSGKLVCKLSTTDIRCIQNCPKSGRTVMYLRGLRTKMYYIEFSVAGQLQSLIKEMERQPTTTLSRDSQISELVASKRNLRLPC